MKHFFMFIIIINSHSLKAQENFDNSSWYETINYIQKHKQDILDFHYFTSKSSQTVVIENNIVTLNVIEKNKVYTHNVNLKKLKQVRSYKEDGLLLSFEWNNVHFCSTDLSKTKVFDKRKGMHYGIRIINSKVRKKLKNVFNRLVILSYNNKNQRL